MPPLASPEPSKMARNKVIHGPLPTGDGFLLARAAPRSLTLLLVEDSRFASDALRLITGRLGIRMRRAETIEAARSHLRTYLPDIVMVDLGLPDGAGEELIRQIILSPLRPALVLGSSGAEDGRQRCLAAGADGYLAKPIESVASLAELINRLCPDLGFAMRPSISAGNVDGAISPDPLAFKDDLSRAADLLSAQEGMSRYASYIGPFLAGVAGCAHDDQLAAAARELAETGQGPRDGETRRLLERLLRGRIMASGSVTPIS